MEGTRKGGGAGGGDNDPGETRDDEFRRVVLRFAQAHRTLVKQDPEPLPEFVAYRNAVLDSIESPAVIDDTSRALTSLHEGETAEAAHLLVMEMEAFSASAERVRPGAASNDAAQRSWWKRALGIGKTATDSLAEILDKYLGPRAKAIWKLLSEVVEIVRGD
jgi:hypothetical protein